MQRMQTEKKLLSKINFLCNVIILRPAIYTNGNIILISSNILLDVSPCIIITLLLYYNTNYISSNENVRSWILRGIPLR